MPSALAGWADVPVGWLRRREEGKDALQAAHAKRERHRGDRTGWRWKAERPLQEVQVPPRLERLESRQSRLYERVGRSANGYTSGTHIQGSPSTKLDEDAAAATGAAAGGGTDASASSPKSNKSTIGCFFSSTEGASAVRLAAAAAADRDPPFRLAAPD
jgi:hypothetical protein